MNLGKFRQLTERYTDDFELVINNIEDREDIPCWGVINYTETASGKPFCLIMPEAVKMSFKEFLSYTKDSFINWFENNVDERTRNNVSFWLCPIGGFAPLDISLRNMAGMPTWHRIVWYNLHLLFFKIGGKFRVLEKRKQEYYDSLKNISKE